MPRAAEGQSLRSKRLRINYQTQTELKRLFARLGLEAWLIGVGLFLAEEPMLRELVG